MGRRGRKPKPIEISERVREAREKLVVRHTTGQQKTQRARIILKVAEDKNNTAIARELTISVDMVAPWRDRWLALITAYGIGATDAEEAEFIESRLAECPEATAELEKYMRIADALHYSAAPVVPPPNLLTSLQASLKETASSVPIQKSSPQQTDHRWGLSLIERFWRPGMALFVGSFLLLLLSNMFWLTQVEQLRVQQDQLAAHLHDQDTALMLIGLGASNRVELPVVQSGLPEIPFAAIVWDPQGEYALLYVKDFPVLPSGQVYQLWLERDGQQTSPGVFSVDTDGLGLLVFHTSAPIHSFSTIEITAEQKQGSLHPTNPPIVLRKM